MLNMVKNLKNVENPIRGLTVPSTQNVVERHPPPHCPSALSPSQQHGPWNDCTAKSMLSKKKRFGHKQKLSGQRTRARLPSFRHG
jgi:hypothetical protein